MEDAHITLSPTPNNPKNSIFGVFDGHGGAFVIMQEPKSRPTLNGTLLKNWKLIKTTKPESMKMLSGKLSSIWTKS
jgi:hypothetical protein